MLKVDFFSLLADVIRSWQVYQDIEKNVFKKLSNLIKKIRIIIAPQEKWQLLVLFASILLTALFQTLGVVSILPFMSIVMQPGTIESNRWLNWLYNSLGFTSVNSFIIFMGILMLFIIIIGNLTSALATWLKVRFTWRKNYRSGYL